MHWKALAFVLPLLAPSAALAVEAHLSEQQIDAALAHGRADYERRVSRGEAIDDVEPEYRIDLGRDIGFAVLETEFSTIAREARRWLGIKRELTRTGLAAALEPIRRQIRFSVTLIGAQRDFIRRYTARLVQGGARVAPASWDIFRAIQVAPGRWQASAVYTFQAQDVELSAPAVLVLTDSVGTELEFAFPLDRLR